MLLQFAQHFLTVEEELARLLISNLVEFIGQRVELFLFAFFLLLLKLLRFLSFKLLLFVQVFVDTVVVGVAEVADIVAKIIEIHFLVSFIGLEQVLNVLIIVFLFL